MRPITHMGTLIGGEYDGLKYEGEEPHPRNIQYPLTISSDKDIKEDKYIREALSTPQMTFTFYRYEGLTLEQVLHRVLYYYKEK